MAAAVDPAFRERLKAIFDEFDDDGGGDIDTEELGKVMEQLGQHCTEAELHDMVNEVDMDGNGSIDFEEFLGMMTATQDNSSSFESEIIGAFATFDADDSGYISEEQLKSVVTNLGERLEDDELAAVIDTCKEKGWVDERGRISYRDFVLNEMQDSNGVD